MTKNLSMKTIFIIKD